MNDFEGEGVAACGSRAGEMRELVERILASRQFAKAPQLQQFLLFIVERTTAEETASINETEIGRHVLRRKPDFDPNTDNIVRVQARHLRKKLEEYFRTDGQDEPVLLTIPKGSYIPKFELRSQVPSQGTTPDQADVRALPDRPGWLSPAIVTVVAVLAIGLVALSFWPEQPEVAQDRRPDVLWSSIARTGRKTYIVLSDSSLSVVQNVLRRQLSLAQYLSPGYPADFGGGSADRETPAILAEVTRHPYTSLGSAIVASKLQLSARRRGVETTLRFPRDINIREFKSENFILIGSRRSVPWMELLEGQLNFAFAGDPQGLAFYIANKAPRLGEQAVYRPGLSSDKQPTDYGAIAVLPNLDGTGLIVCLQGLSAMTNEAAEEIISNPETSPLHKILRSQAPGRLPRVEILLRATGMAGAPAGVQVVATRMESPPEGAGPGSH